jgi:hypothetical protein
VIKSDLNIAAAFTASKPSWAVRVSFPVSFNGIAMLVAESWLSSLTRIRRAVVRDGLLTIG